MISPELHVIRCMNSGICCIKQNCIPGEFQGCSDDYLCFRCAIERLSQGANNRRTRVVERLSMLRR